MATAPKNYIEEGKAQMSLLPLDVLRKYIVPAYEEGILKYDRESWRKGFNTSILMDAAIRHLEEFYYQGKDYDLLSPTNKHHLSGVVFCCLSILYSLENFPELDDRPCKKYNQSTLNDALIEQIEQLNEQGTY